jgi:ABC-type phosphate/phosphonate transport system substrate-binding protein
VHKASGVRNPFAVALAGALVIGAVAVWAAPTKQLLVVCSPGSPGTTDEAQPAMNTFSTAVSAKAGVELSAVYDPSDSGGAKRLEEAGVGIVSLPFFLEHEKQLGLHARLEAVQKGRPALERWTLVAQKGRIKDASALAGFTIVSNAAFAPAFVRGAVLKGLGAVPANIKLVQSGAVLSALRRAANGDAVAVVLDGAQEASLSMLPFASKLEVVTRSAPMPAGLVVTVDSRISAKAWRSIEAALLGLGSEPAGVTALGALRMERFEPLDDQALAAARAAYASAP